MATKIKHDLDLREGDRVTLTGTVFHVFSDNSGAKIRFGNWIEIIAARALVNATIERPDPDIIKAREIVAEMNRDPQLSEWVGRLMAGECDTHREMKIARAAIKAGRGQ